MQNSIGEADLKWILQHNCEGTEQLQLFYELQKGRDCMDQSAILPNGKAFDFWEVPINYDREIHVNKNHPLADDTNEGTLEKPLKTINAAARQAVAGSRILIHGGEYRECVHPTAGGTSPQNMISYEAYGDGEVMIKASEIVTDFTPSMGWRVQGDMNEEIDKEKLRI